MENNTTRRGKKAHIVTAGLLCLATLTTGACVTRTTYEAAIANLEATNVELYSTKAKSQLLIERVRELEQQQIILARETEAASSALQNAKQQVEAERQFSQERMSRLSGAINQLTAQQNRLRYALQRAKEEQPELQATVEMYKSKLGEADGLRAPLSASLERSNQQAERALAPPTQVPAQTDSTTPKPIVTAPAASADPNAANRKPPPANKQTPEPVEDDWLSMLVRWAVSLWRSIFS
jgi:predicted  nucleic acid-binding Zn-ribbon protein